MTMTDRYEYLVEWDRADWRTGRPLVGVKKESQIYASNAALFWAKERFDEKIRFNPTMKRRLVNPWEDMPLDSLPEVV